MVRPHPEAPRVDKGRAAINTHASVRLMMAVFRCHWVAVEYRCPSRAGASGLGSSVEADRAVGVSGGLVAVVVDDAVVAVAQQPAGVGVGGSAAGPGLVVVDVAGGRWQVAALGGAAAVALRDGDALGPGVEAAGAAEVEDLGPPAEHGRDDPGLARQPAGLTGADPGAGVQRRGRQPTVERPERHGDDHGRGDAAGGGQVVGGVALDPLDERPPEPGLQRPLVPVGAAGAGAECGSGLPVAAWCLGAAIAISCLRSISAAGVGRVNRPVLVPLPFSRSVSDTLRAAAASSSASALASAASPTAGATVSRIRRPSRLSAFASWSLREHQQVRHRPGLEHRRRIGVGGRSSDEEGMASTAVTITAAWSACTSPAASAACTGA